MKLPVYVATGFLDAGKTTLLNRLLNRQDWQKVNILLIQFEEGEEEFQSKYGNCHTLSFLKKALEQQPEAVAQSIGSRLRSRPFDEVWIEWNGTGTPLRRLCKIRKVFHVADAREIERLLGRTGAALPEQIASCDFAVVRGMDAYPEFRRVQRLLRGVNPGIELYSEKSYDELPRELFSGKRHPMGGFFLTVILLAALYLSLKPVLTFFEVPVDNFVNIFIGIILQAVPFLLIGVLISSAIQIFIPREAIERRFPKSLGAGMLAAVLGGFLLPVCDCASIPIFRGLVKKGVPLPVAVTFMTATPVINPVVILSTYYAFNGNIGFVLGRVGFGILCAVMIGLIFAILPGKGEVLSGGSMDRVMCSCGCYQEADSVSSGKAKFSLFIRHSQAEFFSVGKFLLIGTFVSSLFQTAGAGTFGSGQSGAGLALSMLVMMAMAFVLSLCSTSDAVIARSFLNQFPTGAIMGFLVFGPMLDIKNVLMLSSGFSRRFILKLLGIAFGVCFMVIFLFYSLGGR